MDPTVLDGDYKIHSIVHDFGDGTFLVRWVKYTHVHDTREPKKHIPAARITYFRKSLMVSGINVRQALFYLRNSLALQLTSRKISEREAVYKKVVQVEELGISQVAIALLRYLEKDLGLKMEKEDGWLRLPIYDLDKVGEVAHMQIARPGQGNGGLRISCGQASYEEMQLVWRLVLSVKEESATGGGSFKYEYSTVVFNGRSGAPRWPKIPDGIKKVKDPKNPEKMIKVYDKQLDERLAPAEAEAIVAHAKASLAQPWVVQPARHRLRDEGRWHLLPAGKWQLPQPLANPSARPPKRTRETAAKEPPPAKKQWPGRAERAMERAPRAVRDEA